VPVEKDADTLALEKLLTDVTGMKVAISHKEKGGELRIAYRTLDQLDELCRRLKAERNVAMPRIR
jgi:ParB family chromosome partitioning protein